MRPRGLASCALCSLVAAVVWPRPAAANPIDAFGFGARAAAMAGAQTAASDDGGANYYNPAIVAGFDRIRIDLGYQLARPSLEVDGRDLEVDSSRGFTASLNVPGRVAGRRVALGGALFLPDQHITRTRALASGKPRFVLYDNRPQRLFVAANLAVEIVRGLRVGAGLSYMSSTRGQVVLDGRVGFPDAADSELDLAIDVDLRTIRYLQAGVVYSAAPWLDFGLSYRGGFKLDLDQVFEVRGDVGPSGTPPVVEDGLFRLHTASQDLFQPAQLTAGLNARVTRRLTVAFDLQWQRWSAFENPAARVDVELDVGEFNDLIDIPDPPELPEPGFRDVLCPRLGVEWTALSAARIDLLLRAGYVYEASPVPAQIGETNYIDNDKHTVSLGTGVTVRGLGSILLAPLSLDASFTTTVLPERAHAKLSPADPVGDYRSSGRVLQFAISSRWRF